MSKRAYFPALDGLRVVCCVAVVAGHGLNDRAVQAALPAVAAHALHNLARLGVDTFFSLSGFLITYLLLQERVATGAIDLRAFFMRRALRIWPVYYVAVTLGYLTIAAIDHWPRFGAAVLFAPDPRTWSSGLVATLLYVRNWIDVPQPSTMGVLWSLCVEEQFYVIWPVVLVLSRGRRWPVVAPALVGLGVCVAARLVMTARGWQPGLIYGNTLAHGDNLLMGALLAQLVAAAPALVERLASAAQALACVACAVVLVAVYVDVPASLWAWAWTYLVPAVVTTFAVAALLGGGGVGARALGRIGALGELSYAAYVFHVYGIVIAWRLTGRLPGGIAVVGTVRLALALALTFAMAKASRVFVEERFLRLKRIYQR